MSVEEALEARAREEGFTLFGIATPEPSAHVPFYRRWLDGARHGEMGYLAREDSIARRADLRGTMDDVRSVVVVGHEYYAEDDPVLVRDPSRGIVARYARGDDYHDVVKRKLQAILEWLDGEVAGGVHGRAYVDTGPLLERELGQRAGLGWFGRNTMLIDPKRGSFFFLGVLLVDLALAPSAPFEEDRCGSCRACLDACPTGALLGRDDEGAPVIDARRCISYLTIEQRGPIPTPLRPLVGNRIYGCDICQEVCPWNERFARTAAESAYAARAGLDLPPLHELADELLSLDDDGFRARFRGSPLRRARREGLLRNVCVGLGNAIGHDASLGPAVIAVLRRALSDAHPLVRRHAAWALGRARGRSLAAARAALVHRLETERNEDVRGEVVAALASRDGASP